MPTQALGIDLPHGLVRLLGVLTLADGRRRAIATAGLLWLALQLGYQTGVIDAEVGIWLAAGVVVAALHGLGRSASRRPRRRTRRAGDGRLRRRRDPERR